MKKNGLSNTVMHPTLQMKRCDRLNVHQTKSIGKMVYNNKIIAPLQAGLSHNQESLTLLTYIDQRPRKPMITAH